MTDFVISTDLIVLGSTSFLGGQTFEGQVIIDLDDAEALLVRKDGDAGDVFTVDTVNGIITIGPTPVDYVKFLVAGSLTSGGGFTFATGALFAADITSVAGDTGLSHVRMGGFGGGSLTSPGTGQSFGAATLVLDEPNLIVGGGDSIATAATLLITGEPTEGTSNNYGIHNTVKLRQDGEADFKGDVLYSSPTANLTMGSGVPQTHARWAMIGAFPSDGISNHAEMLFVGGTITGFAADTVSLAGLLADASVTTQGNSDTIADVAQVIIQEPNITIGSGDTVTNASTLALIGSPTEGVNNFALRSTGAALTLFTGPQFVIGRSTPLNRWQFLLAGSFTSDGSSDESAKCRVEGALTGASGDTAGLTGAFFDSSIITQTETENIADISQVRIDEPVITDNLTGDITNAQTLFLVSSPTEGLTNWSLRSTGAAPSVFQGVQFVIGRNTLEDWHQFVIDGTFVSGGSASEADILKLQGILTGAAGDGALNGVFFTTNIVTQTATESIADIAQVKIDEPGITDNLTGDITRAQTLLLNGSPTEGLDNFALRSTGPARTMFIGLPFSIGTNVVQDVWQFQIRGNFTSGGASNRAAKFEIEESVIGVSGDTVFLGGAVFGAQITTQTAAEVVTDVFQVRIQEPVITVGGGSSITNAQSLLIVGAPTEGVSNFAIRVITGNVFFGGAQAIFGNGTAALPGIVFEADTDTGFYMNAGNDSLLISVNANSIVRFDRASSQPRVNLSNDCQLAWLSGAAEGGGAQFVLGREVPDFGSAPTGDLFLANTNFSIYQNRGVSTVYHRTSIRTATETLSSVSGASVTTASIIPAGALVLGVTTDVDVALGTGNGTTGYQVGDGSDADRWGAITGTGTGTFSDDADFTTTVVDRFSAAGAVTITAVGGNFDGAGDIVVVVHYMEIGARK